jgi:hypothetical protein
MAWTHRSSHPLPQVKYAPLYLGTTGSECWNGLASPLFTPSSLGQICTSISCYHRKRVLEWLGLTALRTLFLRSNVHFYILEPQEASVGMAWTYRYSHPLPQIKYALLYLGTTGSECWNGLDLPLFTPSSSDQICTSISWNHR